MGAAMMRRNITSHEARMSDERLKDVTDMAVANLVKSSELEGHRPIDFELLLVAADTAAKAPTEPKKQRAVMRYIQALPEPQRTIFLKRRAGWRPSEIAEVVGLKRKPVCQLLSLMYADLRSILDREETSV
jgi:DNA-directed RNA polymerase specialized sigma24 family protein